jgi:hypothetical protein
MTFKPLRPCEIKVLRLIVQHANLDNFPEGIALGRLNAMATIAHGKTFFCCYLCVVASEIIGAVRLCTWVNPIHIDPALSMSHLD